MRILFGALAFVAVLCAQQLAIFQGGQLVGLNPAHFEVTDGVLNLANPSQSVCRTTTVVCSPGSTPCSPGPFTLSAPENLAVYTNGVRVLEGLDYSLAGSSLTYSGFTLGPEDTLAAETISACP